MNADWSLLEKRSRLRMIDTQLIVLLARRFEIMREVRQWKKSMNLPLIDAQREQDVLRHCIDLGESLGVPDDLISSLYARLFSAVRGKTPHDDKSNRLTHIKEEFPPTTQNRIRTPERR